MVLDFNECTLPLFKLLLRLSDYSRFFFLPFHLLLFFPFFSNISSFRVSVLWKRRLGTPNFSPCNDLQLWSSPKFSFTNYYGRLNKM